MKKLLFLNAVLGILFLFTTSFAQNSKLKIDYEKYTLKNGLEVILHEDKSDPIVSVAILYHAGSNREIKGRTWHDCNRCVQQTGLWRKTHFI